MEHLQLCFLEDFSGNEVPVKPEDDVFLKITQGKWIEILENESFKSFITTGKEDFDRTQKLEIAISCIMAFVQENFTGPSIGDSFSVRLESLEGDRWNCDRMLVDGIEINSNIKFLELVIIARNFLEDLLKESPEDLIFNIWSLRLTKIIQQCLDEDSITLYEQILKIHKILTPEKIQEILNPRFRFLIQLEVTSAFLMYRRVYKVEELLKQIKEAYQVDLVEQGVMGLRTKFQQKPLPQFHVSVLQSNNELGKSSTDTHGETKLMDLIKLDDDTRLEMVKFLDDKQNELQQLSSVIQNLVLISVRHLEVSQPKDKLADEEVQPYLRILLTQDRGPWIIRFNSLIMNIKLEANHRRTVERSLRQCEELVAMLNKQEDVQPQRLSYFFSSLVVPRYQVEKLLADLMVSLGLIKGALDVYLRLQQWEEVIQCYSSLQLRHKAAEIIRQELEKRPTVKLYCLLGDATDDVSCYEKAWEFSKHRSGLAQRHWGIFHFNKKDYEAAIPHLQKSVEINSLQEGIWLRLGYACLDLEKYEQAASAYVRFTQLDPTGFEAWNNLAKCYIKLGNKPRAHKILQESLKCNYDNWRIWENFLLVSIDVGSFDNALNAYNRLIELKEKYFDEEVLRILVKAIADNLVDAEGLAASRLKKKALEMLAHLGSIHANEGVVWELSAKLTTEPLKKAEKLQKAYKGYVSKSPDWTKDEKTGHRLLTLCHELCLQSLEASKSFPDNEKMLVLSQLSSARLTSNGCVKVVTTNQWESCTQLAEEINQILEQIVLKIKDLK